MYVKPRGADSGIVHFSAHHLFELFSRRRLVTCFLTIGVVVFSYRFSAITVDPRVRLVGDGTDKTRQYVDVLFVGTGEMRDTRRHA